MLKRLYICVTKQKAMTTNQLKLKISEIRRMINNSTDELEITNLIIERDKLNNELKNFDTKKELCFESYRNAHLY